MLNDAFPDAIRVLSSLTKPMPSANGSVFDHKFFVPKALMISVDILVFDRVEINCRPLSPILKPSGAIA